MKKTLKKFIILSFLFVNVVSFSGLGKRVPDSQSDTPPSVDIYCFLPAERGDDVDDKN